MKPLGHEGPARRKRLHYLDWLRALAVLGVFYAHTADIFNGFYWHIRPVGQAVGKAVGQGAGLNVLVVFGTQWGMSLFFILAGAGAWFALASRTPRQFIGERFKRLIIPCIAGIILFSPPQAYLLAISHSLYQGNLLQFYPVFFGNIQLSWNLQWIGAYTFHLWFLVFLFVISLLALPVLLFLRREQGRHFILKLVALCDRLAGLFVFALPIVLIQAALRAPFPGYQNWADFFTWLFIFIYGFILLANPRFTSAIQKQWKFTLFVGITSFLIMLAAYFAGVLGSWDSLSSYSWGYVLYQLLWSIVTWSWMIFVMYFGMRFLYFGNKVIDYIDEAILPFYVLHHPIIVVIAFLTFAWSIAIGLKFLIVSTIALVVTLVLYDLLIRRINVMRWLFGMKPLPAPRSEQAQEPPLTSSPAPPL